MPPRPPRKPGAASSSGQSGNRSSRGSKSPASFGKRPGPGKGNPHRESSAPVRPRSNNFAPPSAPEGRGVRGSASVDASSETSGEQSESVESEDTIRLQKFLAMAGVDSRRNCEEYIRTGRVTVDGEVVLDPARAIDPKTNDVRLDAERLRPPRFRYFLINKPKGVLCTNSDPQGRPRAVDLIPVQDQRLFTVGRLDENTEGLLLITNDGDLAQHLAHPRFEVVRRYRCQVAGIPTTETLRQLREGMYFSDGFFRFRSVHVHRRKGRSVILELELQEGKNREIRRLMARSGHKVLSLERIGFGPLQLRGLGPGRHRELLPWEIQELRRFAEHGEEPAGAKPQRRDEFGYRPGKTRMRVPKTGLQSGPKPESTIPEVGRTEQRPEGRRPDRPPRGDSQRPVVPGREDRRSDRPRSAEPRSANQGTSAQRPDDRRSGPRPTGPRTSDRRGSGPRTSGQRNPAPRTEGPQRAGRRGERSSSGEFESGAIEIEVFDGSMPREPRRPSGDKGPRGPRPAKTGRPNERREGFRSESSDRPRPAKSESRRPAANGKGKSSGAKSFRVTGKKESNVTSNAKGRDRRRNK
jgi:23S rRNA pseudouridine2605 synthase